MSLEPAYPPVKTKKDFVRRYKAGEFGNHSPTWDSWYDVPEAEPTKLFHIRNRTAGGPTHYNLDRVSALETWQCLQDPSNWYVSGMAPHQHNRLQGEVQYGPTGLEMFASVGCPGLPMRDALAANGKAYNRLLARGLLVLHLNPPSYWWLMTLLDRYPDHVIEFSAFSTNWGTLPHYNTAFWEVRQY